MSNTGPESSVPAAAAGDGGAGLRPAGAVAVQQRERLIVVEHPLVQHKLSYLREKDTPTVHFRKIANEVTLLLTYEATKDFPTEDVEIETMDFGDFLARADSQPAMVNGQAHRAVEGAHQH